MKKWILSRKAGEVKLMSESLNISPYLAQLLLNRSLNKKNLIEKYLNPSILDFNDFYKAKDVINALEILKKAIAKKDKIIIYGDYDVDGVMSTTILYKGLKTLGANVFYYIPHRETEGYGLNKKAIKSIKGNDFDLIITCDNGIASLAENAYIKELGMQLIVIDHHEVPIITGSKDEIKSSADAIIDPKQDDCNYPFKQMCAAGLCYRFICTAFDFFQKELKIHNELLIFAMIATFCDIVDLEGDNRIIASLGLDLINSPENKNLGLVALIKAKEIEEVTLSSYHVGFIIGPCINATGRLARATLSVELFTTDDFSNCQELAQNLKELNEERKEYTRVALEETLELLETNKIKDSKVFVVYNPNVHESIAGIVAGRIKERYYHPTIVLTNGEEGLKGSARSIPCYNIFEEMSKCQKYFDRFGGHSMAAGVSMQQKNLLNFVEEINKNCILKEEDFVEVIKIEDIMDLNDITYSIAEEIFKLKPFGKGNHEPLFGSKNIEVKEIKIIEDKNTIIFTFEVPGTMRKIKGLYFGMVDSFKTMIVEKYGDYTANKIFSGVLRNVDLLLDLVYYIDVNEFRGNVSVQLKVKDLRFSS